MRFGTTIISGTLASVARMSYVGLGDSTWTSTGAWPE